MDRNGTANNIHPHQLELHFVSHLPSTSWAAGDREGCVLWLNSETKMLHNISNLGDLEYIRVFLQVIN